MTRKYKVVKPYKDRRIGDIVQTTDGPGFKTIETMIGELLPSDFVALELGALQEIIEPPKPKELCKKIRNKNPLSADFACKEAAQIATDHFRERMPKGIFINTDEDHGYNKAIVAVNRALFGEEK